MTRAIVHSVAATLLVASQFACRDVPTRPERPSALVNSRASDISRSLHLSAASGIAMVDLGYGVGNAINDAGTIVGYNEQYPASTAAQVWYADGNSHGFLVDCPPSCFPSPFPGCDPLADPSCQPGAGSPSAAFGLNNTGKVVGYYSYVERPAYYTYDDAFLWSEGAHYVTSPFLHHHGTRLYAINDAGQSAGSYQFQVPGQGPHAAIVGADGKISRDLGAPLGTKSVAYDLNAGSDAVGQSPGPDDWSGEAFLWPKSGGAIRLGLVGGNTVSAARAINDAGVVVGWMRGASFNKSPFRWSADRGMELLPTLGNGGTADGINNDGYIVGTVYLQPYSSAGHAALWTPEGEMIDLGGIAGGASEASDVNSHLQVSGDALDASNQRHVVRWDVSIMTNHAPSADAHGPYTGFEGSALLLDGTVSDEDGDISNVLWQFGDGGTGTGAVSNHTYLDNGSYTATLTATDSHGLTASSTATVTILNVAPSVKLSTLPSILSGQSVDLTTSFTDPGIGDMPWQYRIEWGTALPTSGSTNSQDNAIVARSPRYCAAGDYSVRVSVTDKDSGVGSATTPLHVGRIVVPIDVLTETFNVRSQGKLPVVLFSTTTVDAREVEVASITLGDAEGNVARVARSPNGRPFAEIEDVNHDGRPDLILHFERKDLATLGILSAPETRLWLSGQLVDRCREISGMTTVRITGPGNRSKADR